MKTSNGNNHVLDYENCKKIYNLFFKRVIDWILAIFLLIVLSPVYFVISIVIIVETGFPVFYCAERGGYKNKKFKIIKFRTMIKNADKIGGGTTALNDKRITKIGNFLRKTKLDEIPQLINIIKGEMSFVGPRPELLTYTDQYTHEERHILDVRPGITDYSSIEFISLDEIVGDKNADETYEKYVLKRKNSLRLKYAAEISFKTDTKLFFTTIFATISKMVKVVFKVGN
ncbi:sugar transferase [Eubacterium callanderi]|uniref:sugar transferase n=1 Tax=Eubacterium callanderi TaxID=53442 RepID=UPI0022E23D94|nr:sugar transferase [Eubacterium callanderi]